MAAREATILVEERKAKGTPPLPPSTVSAWRAIAWFGLLLAVIGMFDAALHWYPLAFRSPEWEFGTVAVSVGGLPLPTIGFAALLGSFLARGVRWGVLVMSVWLLVLGVIVLGAYALFLTDVPMALQATSGAAALSLKKAIARTTVMGPGFGIAYIAAAISSLRHLSRRGDHA